MAVKKNNSIEKDRESETIGKLIKTIEKDIRPEKQFKENLLTALMDHPTLNRPGVLNGEISFVNIKRVKR